MPDETRVGGIAPAEQGAAPPHAAVAPFVDRRRRPTPMLSRFSFWGGRRRRFRNDADSRDQYVDRYDRRLAFLVLVFFSLTVFDAIATIYYIDHANGSELNPLAQWMLERGRLLFVVMKGVPTALMLLFVMVHTNFRYGRIALALGFGFYLVLALYHLFLQVLAYVGGGAGIKLA